MAEFENIKLTPLENEGGNCGDSLEDYTTAGMVNFCLREGCLESEYHLALRTQELRKVALRLMIFMQAEGYPVDERHMQIIDVTADTMLTKRFHNVNE